MTKFKYTNDAITLASFHFNSRYDRGGKPYILHLFEVMRGVEFHKDDELCAIAILHDILEDTNCSETHLCSLFSERIVRGVIALTKKDTDEGDDYLNRILGNTDACRVKLSDLRHNSDLRRIKGLTEKDFKRVENYHKMYLKIVAHLAYDKYSEYAATQTTD